jgi:hypothetical protein
VALSVNKSNDIAEETMFKDLSQFAANHFWSTLIISFSLGWLIALAKQHLDNKQVSTPELATTLVIFFAALISLVFF